MNCETSETFRGHTEVSWTTSNGDERVKQILANVAREVGQTVTRPVLSAMEHEKPSLVPQGEFIAETVGHDPADHIPSDNCLLGCNFHISADYLQSYAPPEIEAWASTVRKLGGQVQTSCKCPRFVNFFLFIGRKYLFSSNHTCPMLKSIPRCAPSSTPRC